MFRLAGPPPSPPLLRTLRGFVRKQVWRHFDDEMAYKQTTVTMLSRDDDTAVYLEAYSQFGFRLNNGFRIFGPCAVFPKSVLHWNVKNHEDINEDSLSLFCILEPKIDILILGIGAKRIYLDKSLFKYLQSKNINVEVLPTDQACATFNFLNSEKRYVAGGLIPPDYFPLDPAEQPTTSQVDPNDIYYLKSDYVSVPEDPQEQQKHEKHFGKTFNPLQSLQQKLVSARTHKGTQDKKDGGKKKE